MYKDKEKQREADRERQRRYRRDKKGVTITKADRGVTIADRHTDISDINTVMVIHQRGLDIKDRLESDQRFTRLLATVPPGTPNQRVSKPGGIRRMDEV